MTDPLIPRDPAGRVLRPRPSELLQALMDVLGPDDPMTVRLQAALAERSAGAGVEPRATTPVYGWHVPVLADPPNVPYDLQTTAEDIEATVSGNKALPPGLIQPYAGSTAPTGWLLCQGQAVSRTTYAALYAVCGTAYGVGDGSTTFNLPNLKGRVAVGVDSSDTSFDAVGEKGGAKTHAHEHISPTAWAAGIVAIAESDGSLDWNGSTHAKLDTISVFSRAISTASLEASTDRYKVISTAVSGLPPYIALHHIIKT
jgi:microcystin-dependent protein